jgi:hypothetical protein
VFSSVNIKPRLSAHGSKYAFTWAMNTPLRTMALAGGDDGCAVPSHKVPQREARPNRSDTGSDARYELVRFLAIARFHAKAWHSTKHKRLSSADANKKVTCQFSTRSPFAVDFRIQYLPTCFGCKTGQGECFCVCVGFLISYCKLSQELITRASRRLEIDDDFQ